MTTLRTTCPSCHTTYKISTDQLSTKNGKVRCGKCQNTFQANEHLLDSLQPPAQPKPSPIQDSASHLDTQTQAPIPESELTPPPKEQANLGFQSESVSEALSAPIGKYGIQARGHTSSDSLLPDAPLDDEFDALFNDDNLKRNNTPKTTPMEIDEEGLFHDNLETQSNTDNLKISQSESENGLSGEFTQFFEDTSLTLSSAPAFNENNQSDDSDEDWIGELLDDDDSPFSEKNNDTNQPDDLVGFLEEIGANTAQFNAISNTAQFTKELAAVPDELPHIRTPHQPKSNNLPVGSWINLTLWTVLSFMMLVTLAAQYVYFNFDALAKDPDNQANLEKLCAVVGCSVPKPNAENININAINHFQDDNAAKTRVTFEIVNTQSEPALVPSLKVVLKKDGNEIAGNLIKPKDFLTRSYHRLPSTQPIDGEILLSKPFNSFDTIEIVPLY